MSHYPEIFVLGDGIAGRAMALAWAQAGGKASIIAPRQDTPLQGGVQLAPNGWAALKTLGIDDAATAVSTPLSMMRLLSANTGESLVQIDLNTPARRPYAGVSRQGLMDVLAQSCIATKNVTWHDGQVTGITSPRDRDSATLTLADGSTISAPYIFGADGAMGQARAFVDAPDGTPVDAPVDASGAQRHLPLTRQAFRVTAPLHDLPEYFAARATSVWLGDGGHMVYYPLTAQDGTDGQLNIVVVTTAGTAAKRQAMDILKTQSLLAPLAPYIADALPTPLYRSRPLDVLRRGRVILCGDAAHPMPPHLAQGAGQSLIDAASLKTMLMPNDAAIAQNLDTLYTAWSSSRLKATKAIQAKADRAGRLFALDGPFARIRNFGLATIGGVAMEHALDNIWQS